MSSLFFDGGLALVVFALAYWIHAVRDGFAAVEGFVAYGLLVALIWARLGSVDIAMTEAAIGSGLTGGLLLTAAARMRTAEARAAAERPGAVLRGCAALLSAGVFAVLAWAMLTLPDPAPTLAPEAVANAPALGVGNPVTAVLMGFRAFDTLVEKVVVMLALVAVWSLAPDRLWGGRPGPRRERAEPALVLLAQLLPPIGIVVAVYTAWTGADAPGGAFQSSTILAAMWILALLAGLTDAPATGRRRLRIVIIAGAVLFLAVGLAGFFVTDAFLSYPDDWAKPVILAIEVPMILAIAAALGLLVAGPPEREERP